MERLVPMIEGKQAAPGQVQARQPSPMEAVRNGFKPVALPALAAAVQVRGGRTAREPPRHNLPAILLQGGAVD